MSSGRARVVPFLATLAVLACPAAALAAPSSHITTPLDGSYLFGEPGSKFTIEGTAAEIPGNKVDIRCYAGNGGFGFFVVMREVAVEAGSFKVEAPTLEVRGGRCALRAVPASEAPAGLGPGSSTPEAARFSGPQVQASVFSAQQHAWFAAAVTAGAAMFLEGAGGFALESSMYSSSLDEDVRVLYGLPSLGMENLAETRSTVLVDNVDAYTPEAVSTLEFRIKSEAPLPGAPSITVSKSFDPLTRQFTIQEEEPLVACTPIAAVPPTKAGCTGLRGTGVTLVRSWQTSSESRFATLAETWRSTDGAAHRVDSRYTWELHSGSEEVTEPGAIRFPGDAAFSSPVQGTAKTLPAGPGAILWKTSATTPDTGDGKHPHAAIAYDTAPSEPVVEAVVTKTEAELEVPYVHTVPAGGSSPTLRMAFAQGFALAEATALTTRALASYPPSIAIASPANGTTVTSARAEVAVSGTASDGAGIASVSVNGAAATLGAGGSWSGVAALHPGSNTVTATAVDQAGLTASSSITVNYIPVPPPPPAKAHLLRALSGRNGRIAVALGCTGVSGQSCVVKLTASVLEHLRGTRLSGVSARARSRSKRVNVAAVTLTIPAGGTVSVSLALNGTGRALLARFHALPVHVTAVLLNATPQSTVLAQNVTVRPKAKPRRRRH